MAEKWSVELRRCKYGYRCCPRKWLVTHPWGWFSVEFDTWADAMAYVQQGIAQSV